MGCLSANLNITKGCLSARVSRIKLEPISATIGLICSINPDMSIAVFEAADGGFFLADGSTYNVINEII